MAGDAALVRGRRCSSWTPVSAEEGVPAGPENASAVQADRAGGCAEQGRPCWIPGGVGLSHPGLAARRRRGTGRERAARAWCQGCVECVEGHWSLCRPCPSLIQQAVLEKLLGRVAPT